MDVYYKVVVTHDSSYFVFDEHLLQCTFKDIFVEHCADIVICSVSVSSDLVDNRVYSSGEVVVLKRRILLNIAELFVVLCAV